MRRRPSGSGEDEVGSRNSAITNGASEKTDRGREMVKDMGKAPRQPAKQQDRGDSKEMDIARTPAANGWPRLSTSDPIFDKNTSGKHTQRKEGSEAAVEHRPRSMRAIARGPWSCSLLTLATSALSIVILCTIVRSFFTLQLDPKGCAMSYMRPSFARFADFDTEHTRFASKYSLYLYREGGVDEDTRVKGIPVLFIPGNAGSYKQVRPIAAEAANHFQDVIREDSAAVDGGKRTLDFFTVDFNEELTAFHGQTLLDQAEYLNEAVAFILALYHNPSRSLREAGLPDPKSVIVLGHSMGGVVARAMLRTANYQEHSINTIVTLSAPHARAPLSFDAEMVATYNDINTYWRQSYSQAENWRNPLSDVTLVSVAGGGLDTMIPSEYSSLTSLVPDTHGFTVFTSAIPRVWTGMDHLAIMWCDQFRKALIKAIYDVVDVRRPSQTLEQPERIKALRKRLLTGMESVVQKAALHHEPTTFLTLEHASTAIMAHGEPLVLRFLGESGKPKAHVMPIPAQPTNEGSKFTMMTDQILDAADEDGSITALLCSVFPPSGSAGSSNFAINLDTTSISAGSTRLACKNAASDASFLPASTNESVNAFDDAPPFSYLQYDLADLMEYQFIAIVEKATERAAGWVIAELSTGSESSIKVSRGHHQLLMNGLRLRLPAERPMMTELKIPEVHSTLFAYEFGVKRDMCDGRQKELFAPLLRQYIQEPYESKYFVNVKGGNLNVHGISPYMPPPLSGKGASEGLSLQLWTDPACNSTVEITLKVDVLGSAGKLVMRYRTVFAAFPLLVVAIVLRKQFKVYDATGVFISFSQSMDQCIRTSLPAIFTALTFLAIALSKATQGPWTRRWFSRSMGVAEESIDFTVNDFMLGTSDPFFWFLVPLFGLITVGVCIAANYIVLTLTHLLAWVCAHVRIWITRMRTDDARRPSHVPPSSFTAKTPRQRIVTTAILLLMVVTVTPYQFAYMVLCIVQITTCTRALLVLRDPPPTSSSGGYYNFYNYTHSMLVLMLGILPISLPVLVVWVHNLAVHWLTPFSAHRNLLSVLPYILLVECMSTGNMVPRMASRTRYVTNILTFGFALYAAIYGVTYAYRLHHMVNGLCAWIYLLHLSSHDGPLSSLAGLLSPLSSDDAAVYKAHNESAVRTASSSSPGVAQSRQEMEHGRHTKKRP